MITPPPPPPLECGWRHADNVQGGGCLWMSKSGGVFQFSGGRMTSRVTRTMSKGGGVLVNVFRKSCIRACVPPSQVQTPTPTPPGYGPDTSRQYILLCDQLIYVTSFVISSFSRFKFKHHQWSRIYANQGAPRQCLITDNPSILPSPCVCRVTWYPKCC